MSDVSSSSPTGYLHNLCRHGNVTAIRPFLQGIVDTRQLEERVGFLGYTPLHEATNRGQTNVVRLLLFYGADPNAKANGFYTPLHIAASMDNVSCVEELLKHDADITCKDEFGKTPYETAMIHRCKKSAQILKSEEVKKAARENSPNIREILKSVKSHDVLPSCFREALLEASCVGNTGAICAIIITGARHSLKLKDCLTEALRFNFNKTAAMLLVCYAAKHDKIDLLKYLLNMPMDKEEKEQALLDLPREVYGHASLCEMRSYISDRDNFNIAVPIGLALQQKKTKSVEILLLSTDCNQHQKRVDWQKLALGEIDPSWLEHIQWVEKLFLSSNLLTSIPNNIVVLKRLCRLDLRRNQLKLVPVELLQMPTLRDLNLSENRILELPRKCAWTQSLKTLYLTDNLLETLPRSMGRAKLFNLYLARNNLYKVPACICELLTLQTLDLSGNARLTQLPPQMGRLTEITTLKLDNLDQMTDPPDEIKRNGVKTMMYLRDKLRSSQGYYTMKLMLVGRAEQGKTTLMHRLMRDYAYNTNSPTNGIAMDEFRYRKDMFHREYIFKVWDFGGQEDFYTTHQCFLSTLALYLLVWNLEQGESGINMLKSWLNTISASASGTNIIIVGTHLDTVRKDKDVGYPARMRELVRQLVMSPQYSQVYVKGIKEVSCGLDNREGIDDLRIAIYDVATSLQKGGLGQVSIMGEMIPHSFLLVAEVIQAKGEELRNAGKIPIMHKSEYEALVLDTIKNDEYDIEDSNDLRVVTEFMHERGVLMHYDDPNQDLQDLYFIDPKWLCQLMAQVVTLPEVNPYIHDGILVLDSTSLPFIFKGELFPLENYNQFIRLLNRFQIACSLDNKRVLIPSKLPTRKPDEATSSHLHYIPLKRIHSLPSIPHGFWSRLISRVLFYTNDMLSVGQNYDREKDSSPFQLDPFCCRCPLILDASTSAEPSASTDETDKNPRCETGESLTGVSLENIQDTADRFKGTARYFNEDDLHRHGGLFINGLFFGSTKFGSGSLHSDSGFEYSSGDDEEDPSTVPGSGRLSHSRDAGSVVARVHSWRNTAKLKYGTDPTGRNNGKIADHDIGTPMSDSAIPVLHKSYAYMSSDDEHIPQMFSVGAGGADVIKGSSFGAGDDRVPHDNSYAAGDDNVRHISSYAVGDDSVPHDSSYAVGDDSVPHVSSYAVGDDSVPHDSSYSLGDDSIPYDSSYAVGDDNVPHNSSYAAGDDSVPHNSSYAVGGDSVPHNSSYDVGDDSVPHDSSYAVGDDSFPHNSSYAAGDDSVPHDSSYAVGDDNVPRDSSYAVGDDSVPHDSSYSVGDDNVPHDSSYAVGDDNVPHNSSYAVGDDSVPHDSSYAVGDDSVPHNSSYAAGDDSVPHDSLYAVGDDSVPHNSSYDVGDDSVPHDSSYAVGDDSVPHVSSYAVGDDSVPHDSSYSLGDDSIPYDSSYAVGDDSIPHDSSYAVGDDSVPHNSSYAAGDDSVPHDSLYAVGGDSVPHNSSYDVGDDSVPHDSSYAVGDDSVPHNSSYDVGDDSVPHDSSYAVGDDSFPHNSSYAAGDDSVPHDSSYAVGDDNVPRDSSYAVGDDSVPHDSSYAVGDDSVPHDSSYAVGDDNVPHDSSYAVGNVAQGNSRSTRYINAPQSCLEVSEVCLDFAADVNSAKVSSRVHALEERSGGDAARGLGSPEVPLNVSQGVDPWEINSDETKTVDVPEGSMYRTMYADATQMSSNSVVDFHVPQVGSPAMKNSEVLKESSLSLGGADELHITPDVAEESPSPIVVHHSKLKASPQEDECAKDDINEIDDRHVQENSSSIPEDSFSESRDYSFECDMASSDNLCAAPPYPEQLSSRAGRASVKSWLEKTGNHNEGYGFPDNGALASGDLQYDYTQSSSASSSVSTEQDLDGAEIQFSLGATSSLNGCQDLVSDNEATNIDANARSNEKPSKQHDDYDVVVAKGDGNKDVCSNDVQSKFSNVPNEEGCPTTCTIFVQQEQTAMQDTTLEACEDPSRCETPHLPSCPFREGFPIDSLPELPTDLPTLMDKLFLRCWQSGVCLHHPRLFFLLYCIPDPNSDRQLIVIEVSPSPLGRRVLSYMVDHIDTLIREWYPEFAATDGSRPKVRQLISCVVCERLGLKPHQFTFNQCQLQSAVSDTISCPNHSQVEVNLHHVAPDIMLHDVDADLLLHHDEIKYENSDASLLGSGGFGKVIRGECKGQAVAIKFYNQSDESDPLRHYREVRKELNVLRRVRQHPFLISIIGVSLRPLCLVLELAERGALTEILVTPMAIHRVVLFRIAYQVADALRFLHDMGVIYRDLKPENVLVWSLEERDDLHVKLIDFGTANFATSVGLISCKGSRGNHAPEMLQCANKEEYTAQVDVYSFGILLYQLITRLPPFDEIDSEPMVNTAVIAGDRPKWRHVPTTMFGLPTLTELMLHCWAGKPTKRPTSAQIAEQIRQPAFQCLLGKQSIPSQQSVRHACLVPELHELWLACDDHTGNRILAYDGRTLDMKFSFSIDVDQGQQNTYQIQCVHFTAPYVLIAVRGSADLIKAYSVSNAGNHKCVASMAFNEQISCMASNEAYIFVGLNEGRVHCILRTEMKKSDKKRNHYVISAGRHRILSLVVLKDKLWVSSSKYIFKFFTKPGEMDAFELESMWYGGPNGMENNPQTQVTLLRISFDKESIFSVCRSVLCKWDADSRQKHFILDCAPVIRRLTANSQQHLCEVNDVEACVTSVEPTFDSLWVGTASGFILVFDADESRLLTWFHTFNEVRTLTMAIGPGPCGTEHCYLISTGKGLRSGGLGAVCVLSDEKVREPREEVPDRKVSDGSRPKALRRTLSGRKLKSSSFEEEEKAAVKVVPQPQAKCSMIVWEVVSKSSFARLEAKRAPTISTQ